MRYMVHEGGRNWPRPTVSLEAVDTPEDFLSAVDFKALNEIFDALIVRSGSMPGSRGAIYPDSIVIDVETGLDESLDPHATVILGSVRVGGSGITLFWNAISLSEHMRGLEALHTLLHEAAHTRAGLWYEMSEDFSSERFREGFQEFESDSSTDQIKKRLGISLNEAVTEEIAIEVMKEYLRRTGDNQLLQRRSNDPNANDVNLTYISDRVILARIIDVLAERVELNRDQVWQSFVRGYMSSEHGPETLMELIVNEFEGDVLAELAPFLLRERALSDSPKTFEAVLNLVGKAASRAIYSFSPEYLVDALKLK